MNEWLQGLMSRGRKLLWDTPAAQVAPIVRDQETAVESDTFDEISYEMIHNAAPALRRSIASVAENHDYVRPAYADLFQLLNQGGPLFKDKATMVEGYDTNHGLLSALNETDEFQALREHTIHDEWSTAFTMLSLQEEMAKRFGEVAQAREDKIEAAKQAQEAQQTLQQAIDDAGQPGADEATAGQTLMAATQAAQQAQDTLDAAQQVEDAATAEAGEAMAEAAEKVAEDLAEQEATAAAYGVDADDQQRMSFEERQTLMDKLDQPKLAELAKLVGNFRRFADAERRRKVKHAPAVIVDVELGDDLTDLIDDEMVRLAIPEFEDLFWLDYADRSLLQWEKRGPEEAGQGPIIVVCDESGSMQQDVGGYTREAWSKALSLALSDQAKRGKRDFIYIGFSNDVWEMRFPNGSVSMDDQIEFCSHFFRGSTEYSKPLNRAQAIVREYGNSDKGQPDVVFITDDDCTVTQAFKTSWAKTRKDLDMTCYGIQIGHENEPDSTMSQICDRVINLTQLNSTPEGMQELFRTI